MNEDITYCNNHACNVTRCVRNPKNIKNHGIPHSFAHLEGNPMFCKKPDWNGNQYKGPKDNHCVCCGSVIPEGRQVCPGCEVTKEK